MCRFEFFYLAQVSEIVIVDPLTDKFMDFFFQLNKLKVIQTFLNRKLSKLISIETSQWNKLSPQLLLPSKWNLCNRGYSYRIAINLNEPLILKLEAFEPKNFQIILYRNLFFLC